MVNGSLAQSLRNQLSPDGEVYIETDFEAGFKEAKGILQAAGFAEKEFSREDIPWYGRSEFSDRIRAADAVAPIYSALFVLDQAAASTANKT